MDGIYHTWFYIRNLRTVMLLAYPYRYILSVCLSIHTNIRHIITRFIYMLEE